MQDTGWDHALKVTAEGEGLVGHAGAVLLRKLADEAGLTAALGPVLARSRRFPLVDRGIALVSIAVAIVLGATSMRDITLLAHHAPVLGPEPSDTTVRRTLELADSRTLDKIAKVRARIRAHVWKLIAATPAGFPWLAIAGKPLAMLLRPGNAGSNTFADHLAVLTAAIRQIPARMRSRLLVRVDGAGASH